MDQNLYLLLGSNLGMREQHLASAREQIVLKIAPVEIYSSLYETEPWGLKEQPAFINQVLMLPCQLAPDDILDLILAIELLMGRQRTEPWGPREIDIDILFYGDQVFQSERLQIPHPRIQERSFALVPMMEIAAELVHPVFHKTIEELYIEMKDESEVILIEEG